MGFDRPIDGVETAVAAARVAVVSAAPSAFRRGLAQTFTPPPPPDFPSALAPEPHPAHADRPDSLPSPLPLSARPKQPESSKDALRRASHVPALTPKQPSTMQRPTPLRAAPLSADACGPDGLRPAHPHPPQGGTMLTRTDRRRFPILLAAIAALLVFIAVDAASSPVQAQTPSADATLSSLRPQRQHGRRHRAESHILHRGHLLHRKRGRRRSSTTVTAETTDDAATAVIRINGVEDADGTVDLVPGYNVITVEVTAQDGTTAADLYRHRSSGTAR